MSEENENLIDFYYESEEAFMDSCPFAIMDKPVLISSLRDCDIIDLLVEVSEYFIDNKVDNELSQKVLYLIEKLQKNI